MWLNFIKLVCLNSIKAYKFCIVRGLDALSGKELSSGFFVTELDLSVMFLVLGEFEFRYRPQNTFLCG